MNPTRAATIIQRHFRGYQARKQPVKIINAGKEITAVDIISQSDIPIGKAILTDCCHQPMDREYLAHYVRERVLPKKVCPHCSDPDGKLERQLLRKGIQIDTLLPIIDAVRKGDPVQIQNLIDSNPIETKDADGNSLLQIALNNNDYRTAAFLIQKGANIHTQNKDGQTPLHVAVSECNETKIDFLLSHNANIFLPDYSGCSAVYLAYSKRHQSDGHQLVQKILEFQAAKKDRIFGKDRLGRYSGDPFSTVDKLLGSINNVMLRKKVDPVDILNIFRKIVISKPDDFFFLITNQDRTTNESYYVLKLTKDSFVLLEHQSGSRKISSYDFKKNQLMIDNKEIDRVYLDAFAVKVAQIWRELQNGKATICEQA